MCARAAAGGSGRFFARLRGSLWRHSLEASWIVAAVLLVFVDGGCRKQPHRVESDVPAALADSLYKATRSGNTALIDVGSPSDWAPACLIHQACPELPPVLPCNSRLPIHDSLGPFDQPLDGQIVGLRGRVFREQLWTTGVACIALPGQPRLCCNQANADTALLMGDTVVGLGGPFGLTCAGDDSRACCNAPAFGADVIVYGTLVHEPNLPLNTQSAWYLADAKLCSDLP